MDNIQTTPSQSTSSQPHHTYLTAAAKAKIVRGEPVPITDLNLPLRMYRLCLRNNLDQTLAPRKLHLNNGLGGDSGDPFLVSYISLDNFYRCSSRT